MLVAVSLLAVGCGTVVPARGPRPATVGLSGQAFELRSESLPVRAARLAFDSGDVAVLSVVSEPPGDWSFSLTPAAGAAEPLTITATATTAAVAYELRYLLALADGDGSVVRRLTPLLVMATATGAEATSDREVVQTTDFCLVRGRGGERVEADMDRATLWALAHLEELVDPGLISQLSEHLWHNQMLEKQVGSYNGIIAFGCRQLELEPHNIDAYTTTAWLLWSKWVSWRNSPERMPDGEHRLDEAVALLQRGRRLNPDSARYHYEAGITIMPVARFHQRELYALVTDLLKNADQLATDTKLKIRARLSLGHCFRHWDRDAEALAWYRKVLELDAGNEVATRCISDLLGGAE